MDLAFDGDTRNWRGFQELGAETELLMVPEEFMRSCWRCVAENSLPPKLRET